jgi:hypothetical protein
VTYSHLSRPEPFSGMTSLEGYWAQKERFWHNWTAHSAQVHYFRSFQTNAGHISAEGYFISFMQIETSKLFQNWAVQKNTGAEEDKLAVHVEQVLAHVQNTLDENSNLTTIISSKTQARSLSRRG